VTFIGKFRISVLMLLLIGAAMAGAQIVGGTITGVVRDGTGAALQGASVTVRQLETGATRILTTDNDGRFYAPSVPVGYYSVSVKRDGFAPEERSGISLTVAQSLQLNFVLGVATVQQQVEVDAAPDSVNTSTQQTAGLIDEH